jgi:hypothetical protein
LKVVAAAVVAGDLEVFTGFGVDQPDRSPSRGSAAGICDGPGQTGGFVLGPNEPAHKWNAKNPTAHRSLPEAGPARTVAGNRLYINGSTDSSPPEQRAARLCKL